MTLLPQSARYDLIPCPSPGRCLSLNGAPGTPKYEKTCCEVCAGIGVMPAPDCHNPQWEKVLRYMRRPFSKREQKSISWDVEATTMQATHRIWAQRRERATRRLQSGTTESWKNIRARVWERDGGRCQICGIDLSFYPRLATLGHKVDRVCGGSDSDVNLEIECEQCNQVLKPHHSSLAEYEEWRAEFRARMLAPVEDMPGGDEDVAEPRSEREGWFARLLRRRAA